MTIATPHLVNASLVQSAHTGPRPHPEGTTGHPVHGPAIALLLHLLEPAQGSGERSDALIADLHRAADTAVAHGETAETLAAAIHAAIAVTVEELRSAGLSPSRLAGYGRRIGRVREFILTTAAAAHHIASRRIPAATSDRPAGRRCPATSSAELYAVIALEFTPAAGVAAAGAPIRRVPAERIESCLTDEAETSALTPITHHGGTVAVRLRADIDTRLARILARLRHTLRADITAAVLHCPREQFHDAVDEAHELLDVVRRLGYPHDIYRFDRLALEYQVTRPGPARTSLARIATSLDGHPDLIDALLLYIRCGGSRKSTARQLHVHPNTVDYRFRRIHQITGYDPATVAGLSKLQAALVVGAYAGGGYPGPSVPVPVADLLAHSRSAVKRAV